MTVSYLGDIANLADCKKQQEQNCSTKAKLTYRLGKVDLECSKLKRECAHFKDLLGKTDLLHRPGQ